MTDDPATAADPIQVPDASDVAAYLESAGIIVAEADDKLRTALLAETAAQAAVCRVVPYRHDLAEALRRRVARNLAARALPLGIVVSEVAVSRVPVWDAEVRRLEAPHRKVVIG